MVKRFTTPSHTIKNIATASSLFDSPSLKAIGKLQESIRITSSFDATCFKSAYNSVQLQAASQLGGFKSLYKSLSVSDFIDSSMLSNLREHQKHMCVEAETIKKLHDSMTMNSFVDPSFLDGLHKHQKINVFHEFNTHGLHESFNFNTAIQDIAQMIAPSIDSFSLNKLVIDRLDIGALTKTVFNDLVSLPVDNNLSCDEDLPLESEAFKEIIEGIKELKEFHLLSRKDKGRFIYLFNNYIFQTVLGVLFFALSLYATSVKNELQHELQHADSKAEVKRIIKGIEASEKKELLKGYRVTIVNDLYLRETPNKKSDVILKLPIGKLLNVLDKSNRSWLLVQVDIEGELIEGWVSRRYTTYFK